MFDSIIEDLSQWVLQIIDTAGYVGIFLSMAIESFFVPFPSELIMPFAGYLSSQGSFSLILVVIAGALGSYLGTLPFYFFGSLSSESIVRKFVRKWGKWIFVPEEDLDKSIELFNKKGSVIVFVGRMIPGIRSVLSIPAGIAKMEFVEYSVFTVLGSFFWTLFLTLLGYFLGENWGIIGGYLKKFEHIIILILLIGGVYYIYTKLRNGKKDVSIEKK